MKGSDVARVRLAAQLLARPLAKPHDVVARMGAIQGQDFPGAKWSVALRTSAATEATIDRAFADRRIVRTWAMRGTLQFIAAADARWMLDLLAERVIAKAKGRHRQLKLDAPTLAAANRILAEALRGKRSLGRRDLAATLRESGISTEGQRGIHMLQHASLCGLIVQVGFEKNEAIFTSAKNALPRTTTLTRREALGEIARRYFLTRGPARIRDLVWWTGLPVADATIAIAQAEDDLATGDVTGRAHWWAPGVAPARGARVDLVPGFDEILLAYRDRSAAMDARDKALWWPGGGVFKSSLLVDGRFAGTWGVSKDGALRLAPKGALSPRHRAKLAAAERRYARYRDISAPFQPRP